MIPSIETIVEDLLAGRITKSQAVTWLHQHAEGATNELRDYFAGKAMQGLIATGDYSVPSETLSVDAWNQADAMLKARES